MNKIMLIVAAKEGKFREAVAAVKAGCEYTAKKYDNKAEVYVQILGGTAGTIYVMAEHKDAAAAQAIQTKVMADEAYWDMVKKFGDVFAGPPTFVLLQPV